MVTFPPLAPTANWWAHLLKYTSLNKLPFGSIEAVMFANSNLVSSKEFGRYSISDSIGEVHTLSLAVEGGGRQLRSFDNIQELRLSEHGDWRKNHLGTLETCLGRKPYYKYLSEPLRNVYLNRNNTTLEEFNTAIFKLLCSFIIKDLHPSDLTCFTQSLILRERGMEIASSIKSDLSSLEVVSDFGRESLLGFLALDFKE